MDFYKEILNKRVIGVYHNYTLRKLIVNFENGFSLEFDGCAIVFDLGIVGNTISYISNAGTLGITHELRKNQLNPDDYNLTVLSRNINDYENKNEMVISYKSVRIQTPS